MHDDWKPSYSNAIRTPIDIAAQIGNASGASNNGNSRTKWATRPALSFALRYGLPFASVTGALLLEILLHRFDVPHPFTAIALSAIALTFWYGGTKPRIVSVWLSLGIRSYLFEPGNDNLSRVLYDLVFVMFGVLMIWLRRSRRELEEKVAERTAQLMAANENYNGRRSIWTDYLNYLRTPHS